MIREGTLEDIPRIVELGRRSLKDGPYAGRIEDNPEQVEKFARQIISTLGKVLLWQEDDGQVTGLFAFIMGPHFFDARFFAQELIWYVLPEFRKGGAAVKLLWEAERIAKEVGVKFLQVTAPNADVEGLYGRFGYKQQEIVFQKDL
jgi:GNAT superfamily N-acetyltransferase